MRRDTRGRLTVPDVAFILFSVAILGALAPVLYDALDSKAAQLSTGEAYLFQMIVPFAILVLFTMIYLKATAGVRN